MTFNFLLIPVYGIYGAVISTVASYLVVTGYRIIDINKLLNIELNLLKHLLGLLILFGQAVAFTYCEGFFVLVSISLCSIFCQMIIYYEYCKGLKYFIRDK